MLGPLSQTVNPLTPHATQRMSAKATLRPSLNLAQSHSTIAVMSAATTIAANRRMRMTLPSQANKIATTKPMPVSNKAVPERASGLAIECGFDTRTSK